MRVRERDRGERYKGERNRGERETEERERGKREREMGNEMERLEARWGERETKRGGCVM